MAKKEKTPKEKKEKAPKPTKEKKPKVKKEKAPKPKKEKAPKPKKEKAPKAKTKAAKGGAEGGEAEEGSGGKKKLLLILLPVVVAVAVTAAFLLPNVLGGISGGAEGSEGDLGETEKNSQAESGEPEDGSAAGDSEPDGEPEDAAGETAGETAVGAADGTSSGDADAGEIHTGMTTAQVVGYVESLPPASLGLKGDNMSEYEVYASDSIVLVDGRVCTQVRVYDDSAVGTNEVKGIFFLSRDSARLLYRYDPETDSVYQMEVGSARYDASSGTVTLTEGAGAEG